MVLMFSSCSVLRECLFPFLQSPALDPWRARQGGLTRPVMISVTILISPSELERDACSTREDPWSRVGLGELYHVKLELALRESERACLTGHTHAILPSRIDCPPSATSNLHFLPETILTAEAAQQQPFHSPATCMFGPWTLFDGGKPAEP